MDRFTALPLPDLVSSRSKYLMNLNNFSALENVSPLIRARGGDWYITLSHTVFLLTDVATVTQWSQGQTLALLLWRLLGLKYIYAYCIHASILVQAEEYGLQAFGNQILLLSYYHTGTAVICVCTVPRNLFCSSIWPKMLLGVPLESGSGLQWVVSKDFHMFRHHARTLEQPNPLGSRRHLEIVQNCPRHFYPRRWPQKMITK